MTDEKNEIEYVEPIKRTLTMTSILWAFDRWDAKGDQWKNNLPYQALHASKVLLKKYGDVFKEIRTGNYIQLSKEQMDEIGIPVISGVKGLGKQNLFFVYKDRHSKNNVGDLINE